MAKHKKRAHKKRAHKKKAHPVRRRKRVGKKIDRRTIKHKHKKYGAVKAHRRRVAAPKKKRRRRSHRVGAPAGQMSLAFGFGRRK
jgi:hypothetical protein